ncbi:MarR family winged helix-turn-helix transcriptional regulator [Larkinella insperata]|uniref:MarR family winged helix-turn-helix transcriptional regulator n=1 Tax=Larkinella insperata TaxID=332158 RepID=A0ABW3QEF4_9BACT|nr:MarR family winged helix-turn-helix transcriptional regulator [Larkinella insperata]
MQDADETCSPDHGFCIAERLRMLSRVITSVYNEAFAAEGITFVQARLLMQIAAQPGIRQVTLSKRLQIEKSALSRDVQLLQRKSWLADSIRTGLVLTDSGARVAGRCQVIWRALHERVEQQLGAETVQSLDQISRQIFNLKSTHSF